jgi:hypothetical protein
MPRADKRPTLSDELMSADVEPSQAKKPRHHLLSAETTYTTKLAATEEEIIGLLLGSSAGFNKTRLSNFWENNQRLQRFLRGEAITINDELIQLGLEDILKNYLLHLHFYRSLAKYIFANHLNFRNFMLGNPVSFKNFEYQILVKYEAEKRKELFFKILKEESCFAKEYSEAIKVSANNLAFLNWLHECITDFLKEVESNPGKDNNAQERYRKKLVKIKAACNYRISVINTKEPPITVASQTHIFKATKEEDPIVNILKNNSNFLEFMLGHSVNIEGTEYRIDIVFNNKSRIEFFSNRLKENRYFAQDYSNLIRASVNNLDFLNWLFECFTDLLKDFNSNPGAVKIFPKKYRENIELIKVACADRIQFLSCTLPSIKNPTLAAPSICPPFPTRLPSLASLFGDIPSPPNMRLDSPDRGSKSPG